MNVHVQVGGAFLLQVEHYKRINGYSNKYFGWGQEDDDMYERVNFVFKSVKHIDQKFGHVSAPDCIPLSV
jgi:predicted glycosyltransferase involved in capsule biosynthesis